MEASAFSFAIIDWIFSVFVLIFAVIGVIKGFIDNIFGKLAVILGMLLAYIFYKKTGEVVLKSMNAGALRDLLSFLLIFIVVFLTIKIIQMIVSKIFEFSILKSLDRTLGFFFGALEGLCIVGFMIFILQIQPFIPIQGLFNDSFFYEHMMPVITKTEEIKDKQSQELNDNNKENKSEREPAVNDKKKDEQKHA